ncbi:hypothetical protein [Ottowia sp. VDI28]|uniref:hypothetical protein n=1 Tax=Ottowia sp. VDI28 TaxID=3133968 RepID=UPI003C2FA6E3
MPIALIDFPYMPVQAASALSFAEPASLDDFDLVVWRPAAIAEVYSTDIVFEGKPVLEVRDSQRMFSHTRYWRAEFEEFLGRGGTLVMLAPGFTTMGLHTVQDIVPFDVIEALPGYRDLRHEACEASTVQCEAGEPFRQFFDAFGTQLVARATFAPSDAQAIASVGEGKGICAVYEYRHPGRILVIPEIRETASPADIAAVVGALDDLSARLRLDARVSGAVGARPVVTEREQALRQQLAETSRQRRTLQAQEAALLKEIADIAFFGQLEQGDRIGVLNAALQVLHALGAYVQYGVGSPDTLMFEHMGHACVLVLLGDAEAASEGHLRRALHEKSLPWANELNREVIPVAFIAGATAGSLTQKAAALRSACPAIPWLTGTALQEAYQDRNFDFLDAVWTPGVTAVAPTRR